MTEKRYNDNMKTEIPVEVAQIGAVLQSNNFESFIVGGSVRDMLLGRAPTDWDIATSATPAQIQALFPDSVYENSFGTVGVKTRSEDARVAVVEVTTFRKEDVYTDSRHPDNVSFTDSIEEDLARRDFTVNAIALSSLGNYIDPFKGQEDLSNKIIRAVGNPTTRFQEDALRLMRAVRFAAQLGFSIEKETMIAIKACAPLLKNIAQERIRDEFKKMLMASGDGPAWGVCELERLGLLEYIIPELREGLGVSQNKHHIYSVWEHNIKALDYSAKNNYSFDVRFASLLHDVGKPRTKRGEGENATFYSHEIVGGKMAKKILERMKFSSETQERVTHLVRQHLFYYNVGEVTEAGVRRFIRRAGEEYIDDLLKIREADRIGSGVPKAVPYKTRHLQFMIDKVKQDPIAPKMLALNGTELMELLHLSPGPRIGNILSILLEEVLDDPALNQKETLTARAAELHAETDATLAYMAKQAKERKEEYESGIEEETKKKYRV